MSAKVCRICDSAHWKAPPGWSSDHTFEPGERDDPGKPILFDGEEELVRGIVKEWDGESDPVEYLFERLREGS